MLILGGIAGLVAWILRTKQKIVKNPGYLYVLLYARPNAIKKRLRLILLNKLYARSYDPIGVNTAKLLHMYLSVTQRTETVDNYSLDDWKSVLLTREKLVASDLGRNLVQLSLILQEARKQKTLMQIATFGLKVEVAAKGNIIVSAQEYQAQLNTSVINSIRPELVALGKVSKIIREYIGTVMENTALGQLEKAINLIQDIDVERDWNSFEEIAIVQIAEKWRDIGRAEIARIPYIAGRPITEDELFFDREHELAQIIQSLKSNHVAIWGKRRIGKTSVLHQLKGHLLLQPESRYRFIPVFLNVEPLLGRKPSRLLHILVETTRRSLVEQFSLHPLSLNYERKVWSEYTFADSEQDLKDIIAQLQQELVGFQVRLVWLIDEVDKLLEQTPEIQMQLKALACSQMLQSRLVLVLSGLSHPRNFVKGEVNEFYSAFDSAHLESLPPDKARSLVIEPVQGFFSFDGDAVEMIVKVSKYEPYWIQLLCREALGISLYQERTVVTITDVEAAIRYLPEHAPVFGGQTKR